MREVNATPTRSAFAKPEKLIKRAHTALDEADQILRDYFVPANLAIVVEHDPDTGKGAAKVKLMQPLPDAVEEHVTNALNNSRNAFDQMLFAACSAIGKPLRDGHYPWADNPTHLDRWKLRNEKTGKETIPSEFWDLIRSQQPYPAGNGYEGGLTTERAVATLANGKHTVGLEIAARIGSITFPHIQGRGGKLWIPRFRWDAVKNEAAILEWKGEMPDFDKNCGVTFHVCLDATAPQPLPGSGAIDVVRLFATHAQTCLDGFKARCAELQP